MGKDFESWVHQLRLDGQSPNGNKSLKLPIYRGMENPNIPCATPCFNAIPPNCGLPAFGFSGLPNFKLGQFGAPHGRFYHLPCFRQGPTPDLTLHEKFLPKFDLPGKVAPDVGENCWEADTVTATASGFAQKQFLVFDHTGDKTTMVYSSGIDAPSQQLHTWGSKPTNYPNASRDELKFGRSECHFLGTNLINELDENHAATNEGSDMREDTEEINALLYSDNEDNCSDDGEETSTGHSPSTMTGYEKQDWFDEDDMDEVASSIGPAKRQKLSDSGYEAPSVTNASSSFVKPNRSWEYEDDAESSCAGGKPMQCSNSMVSLSGSKRHRNEKIRETVSILQTVVPGVKGKDAIMVLDEAINYLRILKTNAMSLGLSTQ